MKKWVRAYKYSKYMYSIEMSKIFRYFKNSVEFYTINKVITYKGCHSLVAYNILNHYFGNNLVNNVCVQRHR